MVDLLAGTRRKTNSACSCLPDYQFPRYPPDTCEEEVRPTRSLQGALASLKVLPSSAPSRCKTSPSYSWVAASKV